MTEGSTSREYHAFMVRLWRDDEKRPWRASLQNAHTGEEQHFASLARLIEHLKQMFPYQADA